METTRKELFDNPEGRLLYETMILLIDEKLLTEEELRLKKKLLNKTRSIDDPWEEN